MCSQKIRNWRPVLIKRGNHPASAANAAMETLESWVVGEGWGSRCKGTSSGENCERRLRIIPSSGETWSTPGITAKIVRQVCTA